MIESPIVIDNLLPETYANEIEFALLQTAFPWYFIDDVTYSHTKHFDGLKEEEKSPAFTHSLLIDRTPSAFFDMTRIIPHMAMAKGNIVMDFTYMKARSFLQLPLVNQRANNIHTDDPIPHIVCLYYVNDSDGDTLLFDNDKQNVIQSVPPKKNRVVLFDGKIPHCSSVPTKNKRCVINYNITHEYLLS